MDIETKSQYGVRIYPDGGVKVNGMGGLKKIRKSLKADGGIV